MATPQSGGRPTGIRDQWIGKLKFTEKIYVCAIPIQTIATESEKYFRRLDFKASRLEDKDLIEINITDKNRLGDPWVVAITRLGDGFRISFLRVRALRKAVEAGVEGGILGAIFLTPLVLFNAGATAITAGLESRFEAMFWTYIDAKIHELAPQVIEKAVTGNTQDSASQLEKLWQLKQQGALTQEEFDAAKKDLLPKS